MPQSISIAALGVTAPVHPVGSTDGVVDVPEDPAEVGFYSGSVLPGSSAGSTVLVGHVNYANVPGALIGLTEVHEGDTVEVATAGGRTLRYRITAREVVEKSEGLPSDLFVTDGPARLVLITCGGPFDTVAQRYEDNVVVVAVPVP
jgi:LPXTG-site transpeptidase (sortase) family protein